MTAGDHEFMCRICGAAPTTAGQCPNSWNERHQPGFGNNVFTNANDEDKSRYLFAENKRLRTENERLRGAIREEIMPGCQCNRCADLLKVLEVKP